MKRLRSMLERLHFRTPISAIVPENPVHAATLDRADAVLADPRIKRILSSREAEMKAGFARGGKRLSR